jgi:hypothetical protein
VDGCAGGIKEVAIHGEEAQGAVTGILGVALGTIEFVEHNGGGKLV